MGFASLAALINALDSVSGFTRTMWRKDTFGTTAQAAGTWYSLFVGGGTPPAESIFGTGTNLAFQALTDTTANATGIPHGGDVTTATKHLISAAAHSASATTMPCVFVLVDLLGFYPITTVTTTGDQALNNTVTLPRYANGVGVQAFVTPSTVMGAATPNIRLTYTNTVPTAGQLTPTTLPVGNTAAPVSQIVYAGPSAVGKYGPFMPLAIGDAGIKSVQQFNLSASYVSGVLNLVLCRPLLTIPMTTLGVTSERDTLSQVPSLPRIYDGACLAWLMYAGAATPVSSPFYGHLEFAWG